MRMLDGGGHGRAVEPDGPWWPRAPREASVIGPGIYLQNVRNPSTVVRSRMNNVLAGREAVERR